jgi:hypothetical protein
MFVISTSLISVGVPFLAEGVSLLNFLVLFEIYKLFCIWTYVALYETVNLSVLTIMGTNILIH